MVSNTKQHAQFINIKQVASKLGFGVRYVYEHMDDGSMPPPKVRRPKFTRFLLSEIDDWMHAGCPNWIEWKGKQ